MIYLPVDLLDRLTGRRDPLTPPRGLIYTGSGDFRRQGVAIANDLIDLAGLQHNHRILDVGSGIGRTARPLVTYLGPAGSYEGFDVVKTGVRWCQKHISSRFPNFHFRYIPLNNDLYRHSGDDAAQFQFPYPSNSFNIAAVVSVFTHMLPEEVDNYLKELQRVLRMGGKVYATFFILNESSLAAMSRQSHFTFPYDYGHYRLMDRKVKAANVAYREDYLLPLLKERGFKILHYLPGYWSGRPRPESHSFQDVLVLKNTRYF